MSQQKKCPEPKIKSLKAQIQFRPWAVGFVSFMRDVWEQEHNSPNNTFMRDHNLFLNREILVQNYLHITQ